MASISSWLRSIGIEPRRILRAPSALGRYFRDRRGLRPGLDDSFAWGPSFPVLSEWHESSGGLGAYFHQDLTVARWVLDAAPSRHVDVGSRIDGFVGHLSLFRQVEVLDIRPQTAAVRNVVFHQLDVMEELPPQWRECTESLSCLHCIEHFGLGRYGDTVDADGHLRGLQQLKAMVKPGGVIYLSTPLGPQRVEFNAHRVFSAATLLGWFGDGWEIVKFAVIDDDERLIENPRRDASAVENHFGCDLGVGIVAARKS